MADTEYLNEERKKTWERIEALEKALPEIRTLAENAKNLAESKISTAEADAKKAFDASQELIKQTTNQNEDVLKLLDEIKDTVSVYKENKKALNNAINAATDINEKAEKLSENENKLSETQTGIQSLQAEATANLSATKTIKENILAIEADTTSSLKKMTDLQAKANERKSEIDDLYYKIMGYDTDEGTHEEGLKDELEKSYKSTSEECEKLKNSFLKFSVDNKKTFEYFIEDARKKKDDLFKKIRSYLPDSVTAGLAGAFYAKKESEENERRATSEKFRNVIHGMVVVELLPFAVYAIWLFTGKPLDEVIRNIPNMTLAVLPLYIPLIWFAVLLNRQINLSKKLIEEYAYKEAVCKSYAGLSEQIETVADKKTLQELRLKLIDLVMMINADNPGKYIKDYDKCDNPFLEAFSSLKNMSQIKLKTHGTECNIQISEKEQKDKDEQ